MAPHLWAHRVFVHVYRWVYTSTASKLVISTWTNARLDYVATSVATRWAAIIQTWLAKGFCLSFLPLLLAPVYFYIRKLRVMMVFSSSGFLLYPLYICITRWRRLARARTHANLTLHLVCLSVCLLVKPLYAFIGIILPACVYVYIAKMQMHGVGEA